MSLSNLVPYLLFNLIALHNQNHHRFSTSNALLYFLRPDAAGAFAQACGAKQLVLTHFSSRYKGDDSAESIAIMNRIVGQAVETFQSNSVVAAQDLMEIKLTAQKGPRDLVSPSAAMESAAAAADLYLRKAGQSF